MTRAVYIIAVLSFLLLSILSGCTGGDAGIKYTDDGSKVTSTRTNKTPKKTDNAFKKTNAAPAALNVRKPYTVVDSYWNINVGRDLREIYRNLGKPDRIKLSYVTNQHLPDTIDELYELDYNGLKLMVYKATFVQKEFVYYILSENDSWIFFDDIKVGTRTNMLISKLGESDREMTNILIYNTRNVSDAAQINFFLKDDEVIKIEWYTSEF